MNKIIIIGNLGNDPTLGVTQNGHDVYRFRVASHRSYTKSNGTKADETEWFSCSAFGATGERCNQLLYKGRQVYIEGRINGSAYIDRSGQPQYSLNVNVERFQALGPRSAEPQFPAPQHAAAAVNETDEEFEEDPF